MPKPRNKKKPFIPKKNSESFNLLPPLPRVCCGSGCNPCVNDLYEQEVAAWERRQSAATPPGPALQLSQTEYCQFRLEAVRPTTPTTLVLTFSLPEKGGLLGHGPGQHLVLQFTSAGELLIRQLSILSPPHSPGQFSLCVRVYPGGRLGGAVTDWRPGTRLNMRGPFGYSHQAGQCERLLLLAQGTGIVPFFSIIQSELEGECRLRLLYSVSAREEIICEEELNELCGFWNFSARIFLGAGQEAGRGARCRSGSSSRPASPTRTSSRRPSATWRPPGPSCVAASSTWTRSSTLFSNAD